MLDDFKIILKGAIGSLTFGAYHMYLATNMINESNRNIQLRLDESNRNIQLRLDESNSNIQLRLDNLSEKIGKLEKKNIVYIS
jgi:hypothetical protein